MTIQRATYLLETWHRITPALPTPQEQAAKAKMGHLFIEDINGRMIRVQVQVEDLERAVKSSCPSWITHRI
mgnify:CR=1 FL=1